MKTFSGSTLRRRLAGVALMFAALGMAPAHAVLNDGFFELDGNVANGAVATDDWASFFAGGQAPHTTKATGIVGDAKPAVFRNGSKDIQDVSAWRYDLGSSPPKDDMLNAYAAAYTATANMGATSVGDLLIYFGADRAAFNGTASLGFWFFKKSIARNDATNSFVIKGTTTPATHSEGDVLLAFEYTNGGAVTGVRVFRWENGALSDKGVIGTSATTVAGVSCDSSIGQDKICGTTNGGNVALPWTGAAIQPGQLFEGGVNINKLFPGTSDGCFASFMATSRSSDQPNASIKNFLLNEFPVCHVTLFAACDPDNSNYQDATQTTLNAVIGRLLNDGGGPLSNIVISASNSATTGFDAGIGYYTCKADGTPDQPTSLPASLAQNTSICFRGKYTSTFLTSIESVSASAAPGATSNTVNVNSCVPSPNLALVVTKLCDDPGVILGLNNTSTGLTVLSKFKGRVTNNSTVTLTNVTVCEAHEQTYGPGQGPCEVTHQTFNIGTLAPGAFADYSGSYFPTTALTALGVPSFTKPFDVQFKDQAAAFGSPPAILGTVPVKAPPVEAMCPLCKP